MTRPELRLRGRARAGRSGRSRDDGPGRRLRRPSATRAAVTLPKRYRLHHRGRPGPVRWLRRPPNRPGRPRRRRTPRPAPWGRPPRAGRKCSWRVAVGPPAPELGRVAEAVALEVLVGGLDDELGAYRLERQVLGRRSSGSGAGQPLRRGPRARAPERPGLPWVVPRRRTSPEGRSGRAPPPVGGAARRGRPR